MIARALGIRFSSGTVQIFVTFGLSIYLVGLAQTLFGSDFRSINDGLPSNRTVSLGQVTLPLRRSPAIRRCGGPVWGCDRRGHGVGGVAVPESVPMDAEEGKTAASADQGQWSHTLWVMVGIQFVMTLSFTVLSPILPLFLPQLGVHDPAAVDLWTGVLNAMTPLVAAFVSPFWGRLADRRGRKLMLIRSSIAISLFTALMGLSQNVWEFLAFRSLMGAFAGFTAAAITLVASQVPEGRLGYALGWLSTGQLVGGLAGPIVGGLLADATGSYRVPFFCTAALSALAMVLASVLVKENFTPQAGGKKGVSALGGLRMLASAGGLLPLFVVLLIAQFAVRTVQPVVTLYVQALVGNVANLATLGGLAFSVTGLADVIASPFLGKRSDVLGYRRVLLISLFGAALFSAPQAFAGHYWEFVAERFGVGMFIGGILPTANALVGRMVAASDRGLVYGLTASATFLGNSLGPLTGGVVAATLGLRWVFVVTAGALVANLVWVWMAVPASVDRRWN